MKNEDAHIKNIPYATRFRSGLNAAVLGSKIPRQVPAFSRVAAGIFFMCAGCSKLFNVLIFNDRFLNYACVEIKHRYRCGV